MSNLPKGWELKRIGSFASIVTGNTPPTKDIENFGNEYPWITPTDIKSSKDIFSSERKLSEKGYSISRQLPKNTVLITSIASIGKNAILRENGSCNQQINAILPSENHNTDFIYYWFEKNTDYIKSLAGQTAVPILNKKDFSNIIIPLPLLEEQKKIADILSSVDKKIAFVEENINATEELKKGLMQKLLTEGIGHTEFKDSELGRIPESWEIYPLKKGVISFIVPMRDKPKIFNGNIPWCRIEDFNGKYLEDSKSNQYVSEETISSMNLKVYPVGTVLCSCSARLGVCSITTQKLITNQTFIGLVVNSEYLFNEYLYYVMISYANKLQSLSTGTTISYLPREKFEKFTIQFPPLKEQKQIAEILSTVDNKLENLKEKKQSFEELKKGLMQKLLTGEVRV